MGAQSISIIGALLLFCAACSDSDRETSDVVQPAAESSLTTPAVPPADTTQSHAPDNDPPPDPVIAWLDGVDQNWDALWPAAEVFIEHDCVMLRSPDGTDDPALTVWPTGTTWDHEASAIVLADGVVVYEGDVIEVGGGQVPFDQAGGNNANAAGLGNDGLARLQACADDHPGSPVWMLDADGSVGPASSG